MGDLGMGELRHSLWALDRGAPLSDTARILDCVCDDDDRERSGGGADLRANNPVRSIYAIINGKPTMPTGTNADAIIVAAERKIQKILLDLDETLGGKISSVQIDTRNFADMHVEICTSDDV